MPGHPSELTLRPATLDDAGIVADLDTVIDPDEPHEAVVIRHWWKSADANDVTMRQVAVRGGEAVAFVTARHDPWEMTAERYGTFHLRVRDDVWSDDGFESLVKVAEEWLRAEGVSTAITRRRADVERDLHVLDRLGYREKRRGRTSELDLAERREHIVQMAMATHKAMREVGVRLMKLSEDEDPEKLHKLYRMMVEAERDVPTTAPWRVLGFDAWQHFWFDNPGVRPETFWIAREGESIVGMTALDFPVTRGVPYTGMTATSPAVRGRGIAKALKYQAMNQAVELGFARVRTNNDSDNAPMLRINTEMGYRLVVPTLELHRRLDG